MINLASAPREPVDCRIGSLEITLDMGGTCRTVDCRIGSLETFIIPKPLQSEVDCRIGSLEKLLLHQLEAVLR